MPDLNNMYYNDLVLQAWHNVAGFGGTLVDLTGGKKIKDQQIAAGTSAACSTGMWVDDK